MPSGVPVATVGIGQAKNAGLLALRILGGKFPNLVDFLEKFAQAQAQTVIDKKLLR
jgi:5-(carboxyamino)imidazole ribonucleotide mutase